ncbi:phage late control D family protein [Metapseudomonas furukawaii]|mgnify:CR=1 FL=1|uniref:Phage protein D n=1 Tax=Metapseudomonas furukawaii TaxID=1149133 RepID=A0AAD1C050_METFU|nr:phage late control D family protein [Pseudomonas furukawaii]ELS26667.1 Phage late control D [Pseudomonas furukawaii]BAU74375.1 phage protein D [Pseudomonas furukawaii]
MNNRYPAPRYRLTVNGRDITLEVSPRLISLTLTDHRGPEADTLDIELSDHDGLLAIPPRGATLQLWLGWSDTGLIDKGTFTVDETEHSGPPDILSIRARSADLRGPLVKKRERSWHDTTLGDILRTLGQEHDLEPAISPQFDQVEIPHLDQTDESDLNLITRLGQDFDAVATIKHGRLLFMPIGQGETASGKDLPVVTLTRADGDQHRFLQADRDAYSGVKAHYYDLDGSERLEAIVGDEDNAKTLRHTYADRSSALRAAKAEWKKIQRGSATLSFTLARGRPDLSPEWRYRVEGIKTGIGAIEWLGERVTHELADGGMTTGLELEQRTGQS